MQNKEDARKQLMKWMYLFFFVLALIICRIFIYTAISWSHEPDVSEVLLNRQGGIFSGEDLSKTSLSEGQVKQLFYETAVKSLSYDYLSFVSKENYANLLNGKESVDLPDHRDVLSPWFTEQAYKEVLATINEMPWMSDFYNERIQLVVRTSRPPVRLNVNTAWIVNPDGELEASYSGFFYVESNSPVVRNRSYRVDYSGTIKRVPLTGFSHPNDYYFPPLVNLNTSGWKVSSLTLDATRRN